MRNKTNQKKIIQEFKFFVVRSITNILDNVFLFEETFFLFLRFYGNV